MKYGRCPGTNMAVISSTEAMELHFRTPFILDHSWYDDVVYVDRRRLKRQRRRYA